MTSSKKRAWSLDQLAKAEFFHQKLHEWQLLEVAQQIDHVKGETLSWDRAALKIADSAWAKVIHRGIKPVLLFAHPEILLRVPLSTGYYRMLAMVSQKSMSQVGLSTVRYEQGRTPKLAVAQEIARHLNNIISMLIMADDEIVVREFDLWRGMAAGAQAQGSWQNTKGRKMELLLQGLIRRRVQANNGVTEEQRHKSRFILRDGRVIVFADEPDIAIYRDEQIIAAIEVKGGIDKAGILERVGAALKSLRRVKEANATSVTILLMPEVSMTPQAVIDLQSNQATVNQWFTVEDVLEDEASRSEFFRLLNL